VEPGKVLLSNTKHDHHRRGRIGSEENRDSLNRPEKASGKWVAAVLRY